MNFQTLIGEPWSDVLRERLLAQFDSLLAPILLGLLLWAYRRVANATFLVRFSLRTRLTAAIAVLALLCILGAELGAGATPLLGFAFVGFGLLVFWILKDVSRVGITNAFETTARGVSAKASMKEVRHELAFLGIGAKKLTETAEFDAMLKRCKASGGRLRFLLSNPENPALEEMARQNNRNDLSYRSRVRESIREILTRAAASGVAFEVRLYDMKQRTSLPQFRLMFIDDRLCIFSQLVWSTAEGLDNPQMILKRNRNSASSSLYQGYLEYFEDLWNLETTMRIDAASVAAWPA